MRPHRLIAGIALALAASAALQAAAQPRPSEYDVKAAYLSKFAPFVDWPSAAFSGEASPFILCVVGKDPFGQGLDKAIVGQTLNARPVQVRRLPRIEPRSGCHMAFLGGAKDQSPAEAATLVSREPVLTITDEAGGPAHGMVHFVTRERRIRFVIDNGAAERGGLKLSSKLLSLAVAVKP